MAEKELERLAALAPSCRQRSGCLRSSLGQGLRGRASLAQAVGASRCLRQLAAVSAEAEPLIVARVDRRPELDLAPAST